MAAKSAKSTPAAAEALGERIPVEFRGDTFHIDNPQEWSFDALEALEQGKVATFLVAILGPDAPRFRALRLRVGDLEEFVQAALSAAGIQGN